MLTLLRHRGPDSEGVLVSSDGRAAFANTRLAIVDVHTAFEVPMRNGQGAMLTFNGEVYNYADERQRLAGHGVRFRTQSDTEVLLEGLHVEGAAFLDRLDGFWSFAFHDGRGGALLARDLMGERQLYYRVEGDELMFASEVNPILAELDNPAFDADAVIAAFRYRSAPPDRSLIAGVRRLRAGHLIEIAPDGRMQERRYARLRPERWTEFFAARPSLEQVCDVYEEQVSAACRSRIPAEVGYLATLSGGLDSTLVNLYASDFGRRPIRSLYGESAPAGAQVPGHPTEADASRFTAKRLGSQHTFLDMRVGATADTAAEVAENSFDGILCEGSIGFQLLAQETARQGARVLILSDGPDEMLGGYPKDYNALHIDETLPEGQKAEARAAIATGTTPAQPPLAPIEFVNWTYLHARPFSFRPIHGGTPEDHLAALFDLAAAARSAAAYGRLDSESEATAAPLGLAQRMSLSYSLHSLPGYFNCRSDRAIMRESIESRLPLQAPALASLMLATPRAYRYGPNGEGKLVFRKLIERHLGPEIAWRPKLGFYAPPWQLPDVRDRLRIEATIRDSAAFDAEPFGRHARTFLLAPENARLRWFGYCVAKVHERLKRRDFGYRIAVPSRASMHDMAIA